MKKIEYSVLASLSSYFGALIVSIAFIYAQAPWVQTKGSPSILQMVFLIIIFISPFALLRLAGSVGRSDPALSMATILINVLLTTGFGIVFLVQYFSEDTPMTGADYTFFLLLMIGIPSALLLLLVGIIVRLKKG